MCHLILLMPVIGLAAFWIWPFDIALPVYLIILAVSGLFYAAIMKSMRRKVVTGREGLRDQVVDVIQMSGHVGSVRLHATVWRAVSEDDLRPGDHARVIGVDSLTLRVKKEPAA
jgi:membrane protein implicated in regulation of membrane protease activity